MANAVKISINGSVNAPVETVWQMWNNPPDVMQWNAADPSWHCPSSENDLRPGGKFKHRMEAKDGSYGFDFEGQYDKVEPVREITYSMSDGRTVSTWFSEHKGTTTIKTTFDAETENDPELQKQGWQAILNNFMNYVESKNPNTHPNREKE